MRLWMHPWIIYDTSIKLPSFLAGDHAEQGARYLQNSTESAP